MIQRGYTLVELIAVITLIAIFAAIVTPSITPVDNEKLKMAGEHVADALRFAREESRRTNIVHGVSIDTTNHQLKVFQLNQTPDPNLKVFDIYHPISKQLYSIQLNAEPYVGIELNTLDGQMVGSCDDPKNIAFDAMGVVRCVEPLTTRMTDAKITLSAGALTLAISVDSYTGRVLVQ